MMLQLKSFARWVLFSTLIFSITGFAQDAHELRQRAAKLNNEQLDRVYTNNLPNAGGSSVGGSMEAIMQKGREIEAKQRAEAQAQAAQQQSYTEIDRDSRERKTAYMAKREVLRRQASEKLYPAMQDIASYVEINTYDKLDWYNDAYYVTLEATDMGCQYMDYNAARVANLAFQETKATATYEVLYQSVIDARLLPFTATANIKNMYERFPEHRENLERLELGILPYFFGANRRYLNPRFGYMGDFHYPVTHFENDMVPQEMRTQLLDRFIELALKYRDDAPIYSGICRPHLNPYQLYVQAHKTLSKEKIEELYWMSLHMKVTIPGRDYPKDNLFFSKYDMSPDYRHRETVEWLIANSNERLKLLSVEEWIAIGELNGSGLAGLEGLSLYGKKKRIELKDEFKNFRAAWKLQGLVIN